MTAEKIDSELTDSLVTVRERLQRGRYLKAERGGYVGHGSPAFGQRSQGGELVEDERE